MALRRMPKRMGGSKHAGKPPGADHGISFPLTLRLAGRFKLHLRPKPRPSSMFSSFTRMIGLNSDESEAIPPLPAGKTIVQLFSDYMAYLLDCAKEYISETHGAMVWTSLEANIMYVLTHPNGWGGPQQAQMRQAAISAGLVPDTEEGRARVTFVTEGEASLHFCLSNGLAIEGGNVSFTSTPCSHCPA